MGDLITKLNKEKKGILPNLKNKNWLNSFEKINSDITNEKISNLKLAIDTLLIELEEIPELTTFLLNRERVIGEIKNIISSLYSDSFNNDLTLLKSIYSKKINDLSKEISFSDIKTNSFSRLILLLNDEDFDSVTELRDLADDSFREVQNLSCYF